MAEVGSTSAGTTADVARPALALGATGITKTYAGTRALDDVSVAVLPGTVHALMGGNGSGKSTLIKVLAGIAQADAGGQVSAAGAGIATEGITPEWAHEHGLRFVHQDLGLFPGLSVAENLFAGRAFPHRIGALDWRGATRAAQELLARHHLAVPAGATVSSLRPAQQTLLAIARAADDVDGQGAKVLVLDEPTARLPATDAQQLLQAMRRYALQGHAVVFVSHHLDEVLDVADEATILRDGRTVGTYPMAALGAHQLTELISGSSVETPRPAERARTEPVLRVQGLAGDRQPTIDLTVRGGEIVGIAGLTGSGRTNLLELLFGARARRLGLVEVDGRPLPAGSVRASVEAGVGYIPEDRTTNAGLMGLSLVDNITAATVRRHRRPWGLDTFGETSSGIAAINRFGVKTASPKATLHSLSGGNQQKVVVARWLEIGPRVLLLDEPTQGVDVGARAEIHRILVEAVQSGACAVLVSSDSEELLTLSDRIMILEDGVVTDERDRSSASRSWLDEHFYRATRARSHR